MNNLQKKRLILLVNQLLLTSFWDAAFGLAKKTISVTVSNGGL